ncbi:VOC family protein [Dictyobacter arantiisoli]|uniref:Glyoxalase n=1 Tax=Dictyobacter arantiisoli TaxID=2014874 RepID=A0A5A5TAB3_9CHLR|nr:VOC family protein [Dictyobacter arantiisoli]GCF07919.1 glyoxalase [Dictyobacter arantiisoli]
MQSRYAQKGFIHPRLQHISLSIAPGSQAQIRAFYGKLLGLQEKPVPASLADKGLVWFAAGIGEMELHFVPDTLLQRPEESRHFCLEVNDLASYKKAVEEAGYTTFEGSPIPNRPRFFCLDPAGNRLEFTTILNDYNNA